MAEFIDTQRSEAGRYCPARSTRGGEARDPTSVPSASSLQTLIESFAVGGRSGCELLKERADAVTFRAADGDGRSVIVKMWTRPRWRSVVRSLTRTSPSHRDFAANVRLFQAGLPVAEPLARFRLSVRGRMYDEVQITGDLGSLTTLLDYAKSLRVNERLHELQDLEADVIELTAAMVRAGVLDTDHSAGNLMVTSNHRLVRIDFEVARVVHRTALHPFLLGGMIGRLVSSYAFTHQPHVERVERFAEQIAQRLSPGRVALWHARRSIARALDRQRRTSGIDTRLRLNW